MKVLAIAVHPDDETLGCGGTLLKHRELGDAVYWLIATQTTEPRWPGEIIERKAAEVEQVAAAYGMKSHFKLDFPTVRLDTVPQAEIIDGIRNVISQVNPELVYLVHGGDVHTDHQIVFTATMSVLKPFHMASLGVKRVLCYETLSSTEAAPCLADRNFAPNVFSDITPFIDRKVEIMDLFQTEVHPDPMPRGPSAIRALARYRGATVGVEAAEAFMLIRQLT